MRIISIFAIILGIILSANPASAQNKYIGVKICSLCHKTDKQGKQLEIWQKSKHAEAYETLTSAKANEIAKSKGIKTAAAETPECLECHVITDKNVDRLFDMKDGVQCETCHNAGSAYKTIPIMKDKAKAIAAGLREYKDEADIEKQCKTCHNAKSPTNKELKFKEAWAKIKHSAPK